MQLVIMMKYKHVFNQITSAQLTDKSTYYITYDTFIYHVFGFVEQQYDSVSLFFIVMNRHFNAFGDGLIS